MFIYAFCECSIKSFYEPIEENIFNRYNQTWVMQRVNLVDPLVLAIELKNVKFAFSSHWYLIDLRGNISPRKQLGSDHSELLCLGSELPGPAGTHSILSGEEAFAQCCSVMWNVKCNFHQAPTATGRTILNQGRSLDEDYDYYGSGPEDFQWISSQTMTDMTWMLRYIADWMDSYNNMWADIVLYCLQFLLLKLVYIYVIIDR